MADLSPAEALLTRPAQGVWLDADARELVLTEIALLRHELAKQWNAGLDRLERDRLVAAGWLAALLRTATVCPECGWRLPAHRPGCDLKEAWLSDSPVSAADGDTPPSQDATDTGDVLTAEEDASAGAWLAYFAEEEEKEEGRFALAVYNLPPPAAKLIPALPPAASQPQAPSGEAPHAEASAGAQDAPTPHPGRCNARNRRGGALCTRPAKANGRCGRHPLRESEAQANA